MAKKAIFFLPSVLMALIYLAHAVQAFMLSEELAVVVGVIPGLSGFSTPLLLLVGLADAAVAIALVAYFGKYKPLLFLYAILWPIVPNILKTIGNLHPEWPIVVVMAVLGTLGYLGFRSREQPQAVGSDRIKSY
ncbi:hypothetical protein [Candidatus Entotheonella palauensis]|uniref:hypothetical protein n=1 Tax=Candidatus Entotheonella palauensis TaxID=93172 RepID=UPI000B7D3955|nr:hypothetical protein [Candidatus Entotheonella palauensis]